jgi:hypothetical protein
MTVAGFLHRITERQPIIQIAPSARPKSATS